MIIVATAFGGAWTLILGAMAIGGDPATTKAARTVDTWIPYPTGESMGGWVLIAWIALGLLGTGVQLGITGRKK